MCSKHFEGNSVNWLFQGIVVIVTYHCGPDNSDSNLQPKWYKQNQLLLHINLLFQKAKNMHSE